MQLGSADVKTRGSHLSPSAPQALRVGDVLAWRVSLKTANLGRPHLPFQWGHSSATVISKKKDVGSAVSCVCPGANRYKGHVHDLTMQTLSLLAPAAVSMSQVPERASCVVASTAQCPVWPVAGYCSLPGLPLAMVGQTWLASSYGWTDLACLYGWAVRSLKNSQ